MSRAIAAAVAAVALISAITIFRWMQRTYDDVRCEGGGWAQS